MIVNLIVISLILFIGFHYIHFYGANANTNSIRRRYIFIVSIILILQSGLRNIAVGDDTYNYFVSYKDIRYTSWGLIKESIVDYYKYNIGKDPGFLVFQKLAHYISQDFQFFLVLIAVLFFAAFGNFLYRNTTRLSDIIIGYVIYSVLFYSFYSVTGIRQTIATILTLYSFELVKKKKLLPFVVIVLIASTMHKSSLIFLIFYFVSRVKKVKYFYNAALFLFPILFVFRDDVGSYLRILSGYESYEQTKDAGTVVFSIFFLTISIVSLLRRKIILKNNPNAIYYYNAFAVALIFLPLSWINPNAIRIIMYFSIFMVLFIPEIIYSFEEVSIKLKTDITVLTVVLLISLYVKASWSDNERMPYGFFWEDMKLTKQYYQRD